jgi:riboflavin synthase
VKTERVGSNLELWVSCDFTNELKIDQSLAHNGVCLTVEAINGNLHQVTAIEETLSKTNLNQWKVGDLVNLERCLSWNGRLDGHIVQGHVDTIGTCVERITLDGSWQYTIEFDASFAPLLIEKGSISLNGISLTIFNVGLNRFTVAIIPYTFEHTNMNVLDVGQKVNLEFDMLGKYVSRAMALKMPQETAG